MIYYTDKGAWSPPHRDLQTRFLNFEDPHGGMVATSKVPGCGRKPKNIAHPLETSQDLPHTFWQSNLV